MKKILLTLMVVVAGLSAIAPDLSAQTYKSKTAAPGRQKEIREWHKEMSEFRARSAAEHHIRALADSLSGVQAKASILNRDFVLEAGSVQFRNGAIAYVNSNTNFISVKGNKAMVQVSPDAFSSGSNGMGGVTVEGTVTGVNIRTGKDGSVNYSMNVNGIGINAQVEITMMPGINSATAAVYPSFNSNNVWLHGNIVPYENSSVVAGASL